MFIAFNSQSLAFTSISLRDLPRYNWRFFVDLSKKRLFLYQLPVFHKNVFKAGNGWLILRDKGQNGFFS